MGPAEFALSALIAGRLGIVPPEVVRSAKAAIGDFKVDVRQWQPDADREACARIAAVLADHPAIDKAVAVPPNIYVRPALFVLEEAVVDAVLGDPAGYGRNSSGGFQRVHMQFSCPNMNKALHLGHLRTNVMGMALAHSLEACGYDVVRTDQPSDWGKHISKAVVAYQRWGGGQTPASAGVKADRFVGGFYSQFLREAEGDPTLDKEADATALAVEEGDPELCALTQLLTGWAYAGIGATYQRIGTSFDAVLREGDTVPLGKAIIAQHLPGLCVRRDDGSVFIDLTDAGMRPVTLLRGDGTAVLHTYFLGASARRSRLDPGARLLFLMGREYADTAPELREIVRRLGFAEMSANTEAVFHGMVSLGTRKMSSRATAVEVDALLDDVAARLRRSGPSEMDPFRREAAEQLAVALVKHHFLRTPRTKDMAWDEADVWAGGMARLGRVVRVLTGQAGAGRPASRDALLAMNDLSSTLQETVARRDPSHLARFVDRLAELAPGCQSAEQARAAAIVLRRALAVLHVQLPPFLADVAL
jgi:arginyl-tRNA synthetase